MAARTVLVVGAHPDDEVLGCGGTMANHAHIGDDVHVVFMADGVTSRNSASDSALRIERHKRCAEEACRVLGALPPRLLGFPDNRMDTVALLDIIQAIEAVIQEIRPSVVYTHHGRDLNVDHRITYQAVMTACRPQPEFSVKEIYSFEVLSSTEWSRYSTSDVFIANCFVDIREQLDTKLRAFAVYDTEIREFPHSRSIEGIRTLAAFRGMIVGVEAAEAFCVERVMKG